MFIRRIIKHFLHKFVPDCERLTDFVLGFRKSGNVSSRMSPTTERCHTHKGYPGCGETVEITCQPGFPTHARYVYVLLPRADYLSICELEVYTKGLSLYCICLTMCCIEKTSRLFPGIFASHHVLPLSNNRNECRLFHVKRNSLIKSMA